MSIPFSVIRKYGASDPSMLQFARVTHANYTNDLVDFTNFDSDLDSVYGDDFLASIDAAEAFDSDQQLVDVLVQATLDVEAKMRECRNHFQGMKYFIKKAFKNKPGVWDEFGFNDYEKARKSQDVMIQFMKVLFKVATKYSTQLDAANYNAANIALIDTLATELQDLNTSQEGKKGERKSASNERVILLNACWDYVENVRFAAKTMYMENWSKWQLYLLPWGGDGALPEPPEEIVGTVAPGATVVVVVPDLLPTTVLTLSNIGPIPIRFCGGEFGGVDCGSNGVIINSGDSQAVTLQEIAAPGSTPAFLNVSNTVLTGEGIPVGEYSVVKVS